MRVLCNSLKQSTHHKQLCMSEKTYHEDVDYKVSMEVKFFNADVVKKMGKEENKEE